MLTRTTYHKIASRSFGHGSLYTCSYSHSYGKEYYDNNAIVNCRQASNVQDP